MIKQTIISVCVTVICMLGQVNAQEVKAASGSSQDIQRAIDNASDNSVIVVPAGKFTISKSVVIRKNVTVRGAGAGKTILTSTVRGGWAFTLPRTARKFVRITGVTIDGRSAGGGVYVVGDNFTFRIDNSTFTNCRQRAIETYGNAKGLIDHCTFINNAITDIVIYGDNDAAWKRPLTLGTDNAVYVENCSFTHKSGTGNWHSIGSNHGSRYVFRYNTISDDASLNTAPIDAHGNFEYGRGSRSYEIYGNTVNSGHSYQGIYIRGGTGVIFNNKLSGDFTYPIVLENYRSFQKSGSGYLCNSYPCIDQISQLYIWNNTLSGKLIEPFIHNRGLTRQHIRLGRDYFLGSRPGYTPYTYPHPLITSDPLAKEQLSTDVKNPLPGNSTVSQEDTESHCGTGVGLALLIPVVLQGRRLRKKIKSSKR